ncbi:MAG: hypothetical protein WEC84_00310 [Candidatus Andersenbacteria bacterium]
MTISRSGVEQRSPTDPASSVEVLQYLPQYVAKKEAQGDSQRLPSSPPPQPITEKEDFRCYMGSHEARQDKIKRIREE